MPARLFPRVTFLVLLAACSTPPDSANPDPACHPLALDAASCFLPFPSSFYLREDASSRTGYRVNIPAAALPRNARDVAYDPTRLNLLDGFSPATQILVHLGARVDPTQLIPVNGDPGAALLPSSAVQLIHYDTGERVPLFAEVDANVADLPGAPQTLIIHPLIRLRPSSRYVVALQGLQTPDGQRITIAPFRALAERRIPRGSRLGSLAPGYSEIFALLDRLGVSREGLTLAWDFRTASDEQGYGHLLAMRDAALTRWERDDLGYRVESVNTPADGPVLREIRATFDVPSFLTDNQNRSAGLRLDPNGEPVDTGTNYRANLLILVPACAATAPLPLRTVIYGHGLLSSAEEIGAGLHRRISNQLCIVEMATDFIGLSTPDIAIVAGPVIGEFSNFYIPTDRLQQAQINFLVLLRLATRKLAAMPELTREGTPGGTPLLDGREVYYLGGSQGGIFGNTLLALSPDVDRGGLIVGGGVYSLMLPRSVNFWPFKLVLDIVYPRPIDQQILIAVTQSLWDFSDPISFVSHSLRDTFPGLDGQPLTPRKVVLQESRYDAQVPNVATRVVARTMGLPQLGPAIEPVYGLTPTDGPVEAAYVQYDIVPTPRPSETNVSGNRDNGAHGGLANVDAVIQQLDALLQQSGRVLSTCGSSCAFPDTPR
jgi:hypothetical protein